MGSMLLFVLATLRRRRHPETGYGTQAAPLRKQEFRCGDAKSDRVESWPHYSAGYASAAAPGNDQMHLPRQHARSLDIDHMETQSEPSTGLDASSELDWASRGTSHVDFDPNDTLPLSQGRFLGHGVNGGVFETTVCGQKVAWKRQFCRRRITEQELREIAIIKKLDGRHIIRLVGSYTHGPFLGLLLWPVAVCDLGTFLEDVDSLLHRGEATDIDHQAIQQRLNGLGIQSSPVSDITKKAVLMRLKQSIGCISSALAFLHRRSIRHKDIKPSNILLSSSSGLWVTDFGSSTDFSNVSQSVTNNGERGTPKYFAPEVAEFEPSGRSADIFSLACIFFELVGLCNGYSLEQMKGLRSKKDLSFQANLESILHWFNFSGTQVATVVDAQLMAMVREMFIQDPQQRPTAVEIETRLQLIDVFRTPVSGHLWGECCAPSPESSRNAQHNRVSSVSIGLGNSHELRGQRSYWRFSVHAPAVEDLITAVHCFLHSSFEHPYSSKTLPPFEWGGSGWGFFTISIIIALKPGYVWVSPDATVDQSGISHLPLHWTLNFDQDLTYHESEVGVAEL